MLDIELQEIEKKIYSGGRRKLLATLYHRASYRFKSGHVYAISGPPESGKTMLLRLLLRLNDIDHGVIFFNKAPNHDIDLEEYRRYFSATLYDGIFFTNDVISEVSFASVYNSGQALANRKNRVETLLAMVGFPKESIKQKISDLGDSEKVKLIIARTLYPNSETLLFDGIFDKLPRDEAEDLVAALGAICRQEDKILIFTSKRKTIIDLADEKITMRINA